MLNRSRLLKRVTRFTQSLFEDKAQLLVAGMIALYAAFFLYFTLTKHYSYMTYMLDLGGYSQKLWLILNYGDPFFPLGMPHQSQLLYLLLPLYSLNPHPATLLIVQALVVPLGAIFLYKLAKKELGNNVFALVFAALYLLYPPLHGLSQFDFHLEAFLPTLFLAAMYYFRINRWRWYGVSILLLLLTIEYASYLTALFGLTLLLQHLKRKRGGLNAMKISIPLNKPVIIAILTVFFGVIFVAIHFSHSVPILDNISNSPISDLALQERIGYLVKLYGPLSFIPLVSISQITALPWIAFAFLTPVGEYTQIYNQYPAYVTPFIFIGAIMAVKRVSKKKRFATTLVIIMMSSTVLFFATTDPVFVKPYLPITPNWPVITSKDIQLTKIIGTIPSEESVLTQNNIAPHLTDRKDLYIILKDTTITPQYILVDRSHFSYNEPNFTPAPASVLPRLLATGNYGLKIQCGPIELYENGFNGVTVVMQGCSG